MRGSPTCQAHVWSDRLPFSQPRSSSSASPAPDPAMAAPKPRLPITLTAQPANPSPTNAAGFAWTTVGGATYTCVLDGAAAATCTSSATYSGLADGTHTFVLKGRPRHLPSRLQDRYLVRRHDAAGCAHGGAGRNPDPHHLGPDLVHQQRPDRCGSHLRPRRRRPCHLHQPVGNRNRRRGQPHCRRQVARLLRRPR